MPRPAHARHRRCRHRVQADEGGRRLLARRPPQRHAVSASTAPPGATRRSSTPTCTSWRRPRSATTAASAGRWTCSTSRKKRSGMVFWHPKGWKLYRTVEDYMRRRLDAAGYQEVKTPQLVDRALWEASGHWEKLPRAHVHRRGRGRGQDPRAEADELPVPRADLPPGPALAIANCRCAWRSSAPATATSPPARCTASCGCAPSPRTTPISSAPRTQIAPETARFVDLLRLDLPRFRLSGVPRQIRRPAGRCAPAATRSGTRPRAR